jgi:hypothetical protein
MFILVTGIFLMARWEMKAFLFLVCDGVDGNPELRDNTKSSVPKECWILTYNNFETACLWYSRLKFILGSGHMISFHTTSADPLMSPCIGPINAHADSRYSRGWKHLSKDSAKVLFVLGPIRHDEGRIRDQFKGWDRCHFIQVRNTRKTNMIEPNFSTNKTVYSESGGTVLASTQSLVVHTTRREIPDGAVQMWDRLPIQATRKRSSRGVHSIV